MRPNTRTAILAAALLGAACSGSGGDPAPSQAVPAAATGAAATPPSPDAGSAVDPPGTAPAPASGDPAPAPAADTVTAVTVATGLRTPWSLAFLPDGRALVTEKAGTMRLVSPDGTVSAPIAGAPAVDASGQGGLLDVEPSPTFATDATVFFSFAEPVAGGLARTAVAKATLGATALSDVQVIFRQSPALAGGQHFGSRLAFAPDGTLFVGLGDRGERDRAQQLDSHVGKLVRIRTDGGVPADNPFVGRAGALPEIWSFGHRNIQGAAFDAGGVLWTGEHGPQGGDEVNAPPRGANHGWPVITYGREYGSGAPIGQGTTRADVEPPRHHWVPTSIAPAGMTFHSGARVPGWRGDLFVGALAGRALVRLDVEGGRVVAEQRLLTALGERIRDVAQAPDGHLYLVTDAADGRLMRVEVR